jgi:hypothetical protein
MTPLHIELWNQILRLSNEIKCHEIEYFSEWTGFLPSPIAHEVTCDKRPISNSFPAQWQQGDLEILCTFGKLQRVSTWVNPRDEFEMKIYYRVLSIQEAP